MNSKVSSTLKAISVGLLTFGVSLPVSSAVFSPLPNDIVEPAGIYFPLQASPLRLDVKTIIGTGPCKIDEVLDANGRVIDRIENYSGCTLADVNADTNARDYFEPEIKTHIIMLDGFPDDGKVSNATLRLRGNSARFAEQKSYRIKLDSKDELWRGERKFQLNKHPWDLSRVANKISFDLMQDMPHIPSLRTDFFNVFIDNKDYGLFTHVENVGKEYLTRRGWHKDSGVYKADHFDFYKSDIYQLDENGKPLDPHGFNSKLKIKRGKNHTKLLEMIGVVNANNNFSTDVMGKYFNKNNYLSWLSVNFLFGNIDAVGVNADNFYLLNRKGEDTFYFLPWDYDEAWIPSPYDVANNIHQSRAWTGVSAYWSSLLHQRYLKQPGATTELLNAVKHVKNTHLTPAKVAAKLNAYKPLTLPLVSAQPDIQNLPTTGNIPTMEEYQANYNSMYTAIQKNYQIFVDSIQYPMGFWIRKAELANNKLSVKWEPSYDLQGDAITYDVEISKTLDFAAPTVIARGLTVTELDYNWNFPASPFYYVRVLARDSANPQQHWQVAFNEYVSHEREYHGVMPLQDTVEPPPPLLPSCEIGTDPLTIQEGQSTALWWFVQNTTSASIDNGIGNATPLSGATAFRTVSPLVTTTYKMTATGENGTTTCVTQVKVTPNITPPICEIGADPDNILAGQGSSLWWHTENAASASIDNGVGNLTPLAGTGTFKWITPTATKTYTMTAKGINGTTSTCKKTITVGTTPTLVIPKLTLPKGQWQQISLPALPATGANTVASIFGDDITGVYGTDWVLFSYDATRNRYVDPGLNGVITVGTGYWIFQNKMANAVIDLPQGSTLPPLINSTQCPSTQGCYEVKLNTQQNKQQWQMLGHTFPTNTVWNKTRITTTSGPCSGPNGCSLNQAKNLKIFHNQAWHYNPTTRQYSILKGNSVVNSWDGFWSVTLTKAHGLNPKLLIPKP